MFRDAVEAGRPDDMNYWNDRFHDMIGRTANNRYLMPSLQRLLIDHGALGSDVSGARATPEMAERAFARLPTITTGSSS